MCRLAPGLALVVGFGLACNAGAQQVQMAAPARTAASDSTADNSLQEIVITAERRTSTLQKTAVSVAVRDGDQLVREGKSSLAQILEDVPGVIVNPPSVGSVFPSDNPGLSVVIRGVAPNVVPIGDTSVASTALYTDGVYGGIGGDYDIDRVEVLRGPQGTLYGRSATGGAVSTSTRDPILGTWGGDAVAEYGSYDLRHGSFAVNIPLLGDKLALRLAGNEYDQNGYVSAVGGSHAESAGRLKLLYEPTPEISVLLGLALQQDRGHSGGAGESLSAPNTIAIAPAPILPSRDNFQQYWGRLNWDFGFATLTYIPTLRTYSNDSPFAYFNVSQVGTQKFGRDRNTTHEVRLTSNNSSPVSWIVGGYYFNRLYDYQEAVSWTPQMAEVYGQSIDKDTTNGAIFGESTYSFLDSWRLTAGLRGDYTRINTALTYVNNENTSCTNNLPCVPGNITLGNPPDLQTFVLDPSAGRSAAYNLTYKVRLEKDITPTNLAYIMASSGFLPGDISVTVNGTPLQTVAFNYAPEVLKSYEIGSKNQFLNNTLHVNGGIYYYDYSGYQQYVNASPTPAPLLSLVTSPARMFGAELEVQWRVTADDRLGVSAGYVDARYVDRTDQFATYVSQTRITGIAPVTVQGDYGHTLHLANGSSLDLRADAHFSSGYDQGVVTVSEASFGAEPYVHLGSKVIGDLSGTWASASGRYSVTGYVRNVANTVFKTGTSIVYAFSPGPGAPPIIGTELTPSAPRVLGIVLHVSY